MSDETHFYLVKSQYAPAEKDEISAMLFLECIRCGAHERGKQVPAKVLYGVLTSNERERAEKIGVGAVVEPELNCSLVQLNQPRGKAQWELVGCGTISGLTPSNTVLESREVGIAP